MPRCPTGTAKPPRSEEPGPTDDALAVRRRSAVMVALQTYVDWWTTAPEDVAEPDLPAFLDNAYLRDAVRASARELLPAVRAAAAAPPPD